MTVHGGGSGTHYLTLIMVCINFETQSVCYVHVTTFRPHEGSVQKSYVVINTSLILEKESSSRLVEILLRRKHSSRIHTAYLSTIFHSIPGPMYVWGEVSTHPLDIPTPWTYPRRDLVPEIPTPERTWDQRYPPTPMDRQTPVKTLPSRNFVCGDNDIWCDIIISWVLIRQIWLF